MSRTIEEEKKEFTNEKIKDFWDKNPVGAHFVDDKEGKAFFEAYDKFRYSTEGHILAQLDSIDFKNKTVLEIGLGQGADSMQMINRGAIYYGIDVTDESIRRVKERFRIFGKSYKEVRTANAENIPYDNNFFDIVFSHGVIHHSPNIKEIIKEIYRVLKPGGTCIIMLYHRQSLNYHFSIKVLRRVGILLLYIFPFLIPVIGKITGEPPERIKKHLRNLKREGLSYLKMKNFIHKSTDGPDNAYSSVWTRSEARDIFSEFDDVRTRVFFLNERHLLGFQRVLSVGFKKKLAEKWGWHLWIYGKKDI